jgi:hypothetical protein
MLTAEYEDILLEIKTSNFTAENVLICLIRENKISIEDIKNIINQQPENECENCKYLTEKNFINNRNFYKENLTNVSMQNISHKCDICNKVIEILSCSTCKRYDCYCGCPCGCTC